MLSLAWLTVFIIFVYVPGSTLNVIESSSSSLLLSGSDSKAKSDTSVALVASSLVRGDDFANEKQFLRTNKAAEENTITTKAGATQPTLVSDNAHSIITKDPSPSSSLPSSLLKIELTQATASTAATKTTTTTRTRTRTETPPAVRTWRLLNDIGDRNNNGRSSNSVHGQLPSAQQQQQQNQLALSATQSTSATNTTPFPLQLTETIQNTGRVIIRGNSLNWGYVGLLGSSESPLTRPEVATRPPLPTIPPAAASSSSSLSSSSAASFVLSLSAAASLSSSSASPTTFLPSSIITTTTTSTTSTTSTSTSRTTTTSTSTLSPSLSSLDGYLNITSQAGTHAYLPCNVKQLVKKPISWLRVRDGHILTVDQTTFIADQRFQSIYSPNPERWSLQIKYVQTKDAGTYECQVSTEPKTSAIVSLNIVEPKTELIGESNRHVKAGSQVKLRCVISQALEPPLFINWYHNRKQIYLHNRKGWRTEIERDAAGNATTDKQSTIASLIIPSVGKKDSGNYTCSPSNSEPITVVLHVLNGEYSASAITSGSSSSNRSNSSKDIYQRLHTLLWVISFLMCFAQLRHHHSNRFVPQDITRE